MIRNTIRRALLLALVGAGLTGVAEARDETVRWTHAVAGQVASFHLLVGSSAGGSDLMDQSIGLPSPDVDGIYSYTLTVASDETIYVRMTAVDSADAQSAPSNEISRTVALGMPGRPVVQTP